MELLRGLRSLLTLLTSIPLGGGSVEDAARSFYAVPLVGALEGIVLSAYLYLLRTLGVAAEVAALTYVVAHVALTGGIHLDGFADYSDVLGSRLRGDKAVAVLKDPRRGAYGVLLTATTVTASYALTERIYRVLPCPELVALLTLSYIASAESIYVASSAGRSEPYRGLARDFTLRAKEPGSVARNASLYLLAVLAVALGVFEQLPRLLAVASLAPVVGYLVARDANLRLGFVNGDVLGFCFEVCRVLSLLVVAL
jgi:adenosylcobinamide-GDP ribazoletransferase